MKQILGVEILKITTVLIYATLFFYANVGFSHEAENPILLKKYITGSLKNLIIHKVPKPIPEMELIKVGGAPEIFKFRQNQVTVINFWATWCAPCREEMPSLNELTKSIGTDNFSVIVVAAGRNSDKSINEFFFTHKLSNLISYKDPRGKVASTLSILGLPTTIIVDQHSNEVARLIGGENWNSPQAIQMIKLLLRGHSELK